MTRLFLRFYLGVIAILIGAWLIQGYVFSQSSRSQNIRVIEQALSGGARLARQRLVDAPPGEQAETLATIQPDFEYPVEVIELSESHLGETARQRLAAGEVVLYGGYIGIQLPGNRQVLQLGPLPSFEGPSETEITLGFGAIFFLAAVAIAILLRPVASQLRAVERTATAIAEGNLSARIPSDRVPKGLPLANAFNKMADRVETLLRSQRELLQAVSHELRTPLARIRFATDLIETAKSEEEKRTRLNAVDDATQKLDDLVGELLAYVRLESDAPATTPERIVIGELFAELIEIHAPLHPTAQLEIDIRESSLQLTADRAALSRAVGNLLSNAARHAHRRVILRAEKQAKGIAIQVDDDGDGVPAADREKIFTPFVRLENTTDRGAGLGLALVHRIAAQHGGHTSVSESPLGGARFSLTLPER